MTMSSQPPPELPGGQDDDPPHVGLLLLVCLGLIRDHLDGEPEDLDRWRAIAAVLERVTHDDS